MINENYTNNYEVALAILDKLENGGTGGGGGTEDNTDYKYVNGSFDRVGLKRIGYTDEEINYLNANIFLSKEDEQKLKLTDKDFQLASEINGDNYKTYITNSSQIGLRFMPRFNGIDEKSNAEKYMSNNEEASILLYPFSLNTSSSLNSMFYGNISMLVAPYFGNTSSKDNFGRMFYKCQSLTVAPPLNTENGKDFSHFLNGCVSLEVAPKYDFSSAINMYSSFRETKIKYGQYIIAPNCTDFSWLFADCPVINEFEGIDGAPNASFEYMFYNCKNLKKIGRLDLTNSKNNGNMFNQCKLLQNINLVGKLNKNLSLRNCKNLDTESVEKIVNAALATDNTDAKTIEFNTAVQSVVQPYTDALIAKNWTINFG